jgi:predicted dehydrogenase
VYNPLPNHLHVPLAIEAAAGKYVLCEKPIALTAEEAERLVAARDHAGVLIQER